MTLSDLLEELEHIRRKGCAIENGEYKIGLRSVSAPVFDREGQMRYTLTVVGLFRHVACRGVRGGGGHGLRQPPGVSAGSSGAIVRRAFRHTELCAAVRKGYFLLPGQMVPINLQI